MKSMLRFLICITLVIKNWWLDNHHSPCLPVNLPFHFPLAHVPTFLPENHDFEHRGADPRLHHWALALSTSSRSLVDKVSGTMSSARSRDNNEATESDTLLQSASPRRFLTECYGQNQNQCSSDWEWVWLTAVHVIQARPLTINTSNGP